MSKIVLEDFNEGDGYYKVNLAYLSKEQVEEIEAIVSKWNPTDETIKACIGMALTDVPETRFKSYGVSLKECLAWFEKQKDYVSPQMIADAYLRGCNDTEKKWLEKQCKQDDYDDNIITRDDEILQAISVGLTDVAKDAGWSDFGGIPIEDIMDWLEKQGEQKPTDKIEPKFNVDDWVVLSTSDGEKVVQIDSVEYFKSGQPRYITSVGKWFGNGTNAHLWTIADAKDGDILVYGEDKRLFIYKGLLDKLHLCPVAYCGICDDDSFQVSTGDNWWTEEEVYPATKEQRVLLFQKMHEAGYEWNSKKKELNKIEIPSNSWTEADEAHLHSVTTHLEQWIECHPNTCGADIQGENLAWLESLRHRLQ